MPQASFIIPECEGIKTTTNCNHNFSLSFMLTKKNMHFHTSCRFTGITKYTDHNGKDLKGWITGVDLEGRPGARALLFLQKQGYTPLIFAETGRLTVCGRQDAAAFPLKSVCAPFIVNSWIRPWISVNI